MVWYLSFVLPILCSNTFIHTLSGSIFSIYENKPYVIHNAGSSVSYSAILYVDIPNLLSNKDTI